jgi:hypothetical protein
MSDQSNDIKKHTTKSRETIPLNPLNNYHVKMKLPLFSWQLKGAENYKAQINGILLTLSFHAL